MIALDSGDKIRGDASAATVVDYSLHGIDNNVIKQLADGQLPSGIGDLYTADSTDAVASIILVNTDGSARTVNLYLTPNGGSDRRIIPKDMSLGIGYCLITDGKQVSVYDASGNLQQTVTIVAHPLGGSSHDADTLSNLNSKVSDATLVDTGDIILKALLTTRGDMIRRGAAAPERFAKGNDGDVLTMGADDPAWSAPAGGAGMPDDFADLSDAQKQFIMVYGI